MTSPRAKDTAAQPRRAADAEPYAAARAKRRATDALHCAAETFIRAYGGSAVVIGGVEIQRWPGEFSFNYRLAIRVTGMPPKYVPDAPHAMEGRKSRSNRKVSAGQPPRAHRKTKPLARRHPWERA